MKQTEMLKEARRLYGLGLAVHWLHPKSKRPIESGWTTGPRKSWDYLKETYIEGLNVGVRLGMPSKIKGGFLCVVDVDVKSTDKRYRVEAVSAAKRLLGLYADKCPTVVSGRGNGSRHYYCLTADPFKTWNPAASSEQVKVYMPSKKPSKKEIAELSQKEIADGFRIANAWEISLYSDGRQVVLPPSIHPDSGQPYQWVKAAAGVDSLPLVEFPSPGGEAPYPSPAEVISRGVYETTFTITNVTKNEIDIFKVEPVDLAWLPISDKIREGILHGTNVDDRSGFLLPATSALFSAGLTKNEVLTVLTEPQTFLGACAYDHAKTTKRTRAALWLWKYTVKRIMDERSAEHAFASAKVEPTRKLAPDEVVKQSEELEDDVLTAAKTGYYKRGQKGGLIPLYHELLLDFKKERPYKTIADMKALYVFNGTHYVDFTPIEVKAFAEQKFRPSPEEKIRVEFYNKLLANEVVRRNFFTDSTEGKINFQNGVLNLKSWDTALEPHSPKCGFRGTLPYDYDPLATCPIFDQWIRDIMLDDEELVSILQEFMGYVVRGGEYKYHKALWLDGRGRNGKSTFLDTLKALIGANNFSTISIKALVGDKFAGAEMDGKIANFSEETSTHELADSGPFKNLTGDGDILAQKKYGDPFFFRNRAKLIMSYNQVPDLKDLSPGMLSRPLIVPFRKVIDDDAQDRSIKKKLFEELSGIFNFAFKGWERLEEQNGFTKSVKSDLALKAVKEESCGVFQWIENFIVFDNPFNSNNPQMQFFRPHQLYEIYSRRERYPYKMIEFCRRLNDHPEMKKRWKKRVEGNVYFGFKIHG